MQLQTSSESPRSKKTSYSSLLGGQETQNLSPLIGDRTTALLYIIWIVPNTLDSTKSRWRLRISFLNGCAASNESTKHSCAMYEWVWWEKKRTLIECKYPSLLTFVWFWLYNWQKVRSEQHWTAYCKKTILEQN